MVQSLEQFIAEANQAYQPAVDAIQGQIDAIPGQLEATNAQINSAYDRQRADLNKSRNEAAYSASMQAAGSGGSFGGSTNIANRKYYNQSFVPAVTQMNTNQTNDLAAARTNSENQRLALQRELANLRTNANVQAQQQYYNALENERARAAQNAYYQYLMEAAQNSGSQSKYKLADNRNRYGGWDWLDADGNKHRVGEVANDAGYSDYTDALFDTLSTPAERGDEYSTLVYKEIQDGAEFEYNPYANTGNPVYDTLGIRRVR